MPIVHTLDPQAISQALEVLTSYNGQLWEHFDYLVQEVETDDPDTWEMLHVTLMLSKYPSSEELSTIRKVLTSSIHPQLPSFPKTHSWLVSIFFGDSSIDSIMGGMNGIVI
jgi:hypothetical protein